MSLATLRGVDNIAGDVVRAAGDIVATFPTRRQDRAMSLATFTTRRKGRGDVASGGGDVAGDVVSGRQHRWRRRRGRWRYRGDIYGR